ncbi:MAG: metallophosphoesterase [Armatimonadetes bacterium]|nr:metallophosphoesterase [Armatimonadota bacterium]
MMTSKRVGRSRWLAVLLVGLRTLCAAPVLTPTAGPDPKDLPAPTDTGEVLWIKPYLQAVTADSAILRFETRVAQAAHVTIASANTDRAPQVAVDDPAVRFHRVLATGLTPETDYRLSVSVDGKEVGGASLTTWSQAPKTFKFFVYGDTRTRPAEHAKICAAMAQRAAGHLFVLHSGDLVADGKQYPLWRREFFQPAGELMARLPMITVPGNHEHETPLYLAYLDLPEPRWHWAFSVGPVHVLGLDSYHELVGSGWRRTASGKWLLAELPKAKEPWRLAVFHTPLYSLGPHGVQDDDDEPKEPEMRWSREQLEPLLRQAGYTVTFNGHDHVYERSFKDGLLMLTSGGGGAPLYKPAKSDQNPWSQKLMSTTHFLDITASESTLDVVVLDADGRTVDSFVVTRGADGKAQVTQR